MVRRAPQGYLHATRTQLPLGRPQNHSVCTPMKLKIMFVSSSPYPEPPLLIYSHTWRHFILVTRSWEFSNIPQCRSFESGCIVVSSVLLRVLQIPYFGCVYPSSCLLFYICIDICLDWTSSRPEQAPPCNVKEMASSYRLSSSRDVSVPNFSSYKSSGMSHEYITSDEVRLENCRWWVRFYPSWIIGGFTGTLEGTRLYVHHQNTTAASDPDHQSLDLIGFRVSVVDPSTKNPVDKLTTFKRNLYVCGKSQSAFVKFDPFFYYKDIWDASGESDLLRDDVLKFRVELLFDYTPSSGGPETHGLLPMEPYRDKLRQIYELDVGRDFVLVSSEGQEHRVHKAVLSAGSPVFQRMFESNLEECKTGRCQIDDISAAALDVLVRFMYYGSVEGLEDNAKDVMVAADKYELAELKNHCQEVLVKKVDMENVAHLLVVADAISAPDLRSTAMKYIAEQRDSVHESGVIDVIVDRAFKGGQSELVKEVINIVMKPRIKSESTDDSNDED